MSEEQKRNPLPQKLPAPVYYVESPDDRTVLVGMDVRIRCTGGEWMISWFDTTKERMMGMQKYKWDGRCFTFMRREQEGGRLYRFVPMTLEIYGEKVKSRLIAGRDFTDEAAMIAAFLETKNSAL